MTFFKEYNVAPNPKECKYWIDLAKDPNGGIIKFYNGKEWVNLNGSDIDSDLEEIKETLNQKASKDIATSSTNGLMSSSDKRKLDGIQANAKNITVENILTSSSITNALSAAQGKALKALIDSLTQRVSTLVTTEQLQQSIDNLATKQEVTQQLSAKVDNNTYTKDKQTFALKEELPNLEGYATESWVEQKGYLTEHQSLKDYLTKESAQSTYQPIGSYLTEIPSEYVTDTELNSKQYATTTQLSKKADLVALDNYVTVDTANNTYAKKTEIPQTYELPIATNNRLGGIKVGAGLEVNPETGVLNATGGGTADSVDWQNITSKPKTFTPSAHQHVASDITDLSSKLDLKADKTEIPSLDNYATTSVLSQHTSNTNNPHSVTKDQIGLNNVTNDQQVKRSEMGVADGVATLDSTGKIPTSQLPSYIDDVIESETYDSLPEKGESGKIYVAKDTNLVYRWSGSAYIEISASLALGETSSTAYAGDKGKTTTDKINTHVSNTSNPHSVTKAQVGLSNVNNTSDLNKPISTATQEALDLKADI